MEGATRPEAYKGQVSSNQGHSVGRKEKGKKTVVMIVVVWMRMAS